MIVVCLPLQNEKKGLMKLLSCMVLTLFQWRNVSLLSRNEEFQEEMWRISITIVEKYLSPHILEKYGHSHIAGPTDGASPTLEGESKKNLPASVDGPEQSHEEQQVLRHENRREKN